ncbi:hypothetical protein HJFPF1_04911 [Paramyrothecium foliicola]|nr:hypothetical protein HJFPF1_04911 [Paramyrothecium foliicola]
MERHRKNRARPPLRHRFPITQYDHMQYTPPGKGTGRRCLDAITVTQAPGREILDLRSGRGDVAHPVGQLHRVPGAF